MGRLYNTYDDKVNSLPKDTTGNTEDSVDVDGKVDVLCASVLPRKPRNGPKPASDRVALKWNASRIKGSGQVYPKPIIVAVRIDGHTCQTLIDSGSPSGSNYT